MKFQNFPALCFLGLFVQVFYHGVSGDIYLHVPRGSNNRLNSPGQNRRNANRIFDSQNNAKGGYNAPEKDETKTKKGDWFEMPYYMSGPDEGKTYLHVEWTNQHGCGHPDLNCNIVLQYKCQATTITDATRMMRNGASERTPIHSVKPLKSYKAKKNRVKRETRLDRALQESWEWYDKCFRRERNKGLFTADQKLKGNTARFTRQNSNGNRYGYECPEERDYYPYWHPTDWIDIAVLANDKKDCDSYESESFNVKGKGECMELYDKKKSWHKERNPWRHYSTYNSQTACEEKGGKWVIFHSYLEILNRTKGECNGDGLKWTVPYRSEDLDRMTGSDPDGWKKCLVVPDKVDCIEAPESRPNHLGNGENIVPLSYKWPLPHFPSGQEQRCVFRIRYNISTNDYDPKTTFSNSNNNDDVIENDLQVDVGNGNNNKVPLQLAVNTAQFGRTFQDRSHLFRLIPRQPSFQDKTIHVITVRGKRGNIVQVYPAVEYDFNPKHPTINSDEYVHFCWEGSNTNPKNNDGEGRAQTDRSNIVAMEQPDWSYPNTDTEGTMFDKAKLIHAPNPDDYDNTKTGADLAIAMATAGYFKTADAVPSAPVKVGKCNEKQTAQLDCYPPSFSGWLVQLKKGTYYYMCTRNNNFTNRNQKAGITVTEKD